MDSLTHRTHTGARGFSHLEVVVGLVLFLIALSIAVTTSSFNARTSRKNDGQIHAYRLAALHLEKAKTELTNPVLLDALVAGMTNGGCQKASSDTVQGKVYQVTMKYRRQSNASRMMRIQAMVTWDGNKSNSVGTLFPIGN